MPLIDLWKSNPSAVDQFTIEQVVAAAGNGELKDKSKCSEELREFLTQISTGKIDDFVEHCLTKSFTRSGMVLQELVNELGRRLDFIVENGRYQGASNIVGFDGLWLSPEGGHIIAEVKTTDAYRISLDNVASYREKLAAEKRIGSACSILIVVGREDTGELEAQVRGSRHAWDIRIISAEALLKLARLKENASDLETGKKIRNLLVPMEYTRLDPLIDVMFSTAQDIEPTLVGDIPSDEKGQIGGVLDSERLEQKSSWVFTDSVILQKKREDIVGAIAKAKEFSLIKKSRALFWSADHTARIACTVSKRYIKPGSYKYWYAYHPDWNQFLQEGKESYFVLGCMDLTIAFCLPFTEIESNKHDNNRSPHLLAYPYKRTGSQPILSTTS
jgi:hypothetical protein